MQCEVLARPGAAAARLHLNRGESITAEVGALIAASEHIDIDTTIRSRGGGLLKGLKRMLGGENLFLNHFTARADGQELLIGPTLIGDVMHHRLEGTVLVQGGSWLASGGGIVLDTSWQGFTNALFSGESMFWLKCTGSGDLWFNSFGGIYEVAVDGAYTVDSGHIVAFEDSLQFRVGKSNPSLLGSFFGGEGLVCKFTGRGRLWCQTHNPSAFGSSLGPSLKPRA